MIKVRILSVFVQFRNLKCASVPSAPSLHFITITSHKACKTVLQNPQWVGAIEIIRPMLFIQASNRGIFGYPPSGSDFCENCFL